MFAKPQKEHHWLEKLVGDWILSHNCQMPDGSTLSTSGTMTCRSLRGMWLVCESTVESAQGDSWSAIMTLGFNSSKALYVGTFIGSMMEHLWLYEGVLNPDGVRLPLETVGPAFVGEGNCKFRDTIEIIHADHWLLTSEYQEQTGEWRQFMSCQHKRA